MKIRWTAPALKDVEEAVQSIARDNPSAAQRLAAAIWTASQTLAERPGLGRPGRVPKTREWVVHQTPYIVAYRAKTH